MTYCEALQWIGSPVGLLALGGIISPIAWEWVPKLKSWFDSQSARQKQGIVALTAFVLVLGASVLSVVTCGTVVHWPDEVVRILAMVAATFGLATGVHQVDVKFVQRR